MALAESRPVDVCLETIYGLNSGVFLSTLLHCLILTGAWFGALSRVCLRAYLPHLLLIFLPLQDMCICMLSLVGPSLRCGLFFPRGDANRIKRRLESPCTCSYSLVQPGPVPEYRFYCLSARDTVLPYSL